MTLLEWTVPLNSSPCRLQSFLRDKLPASYSTKDIKWSLDHNRCFVNQTIERFGSRKIQPGETIWFFKETRPHFAFEPHRLLFEAPTWIAYDKPCGISSENLAKLLGVKLVHRLDRDTTGVMLFAKEEKRKKELEALFLKRRIKKEYLAIVSPPPKAKEGIIDLKLGLISRRAGAVKWGVTKEGQFAKTTWKLLKQKGNKGLLSCSPITGRTHQIRVHLAHIGCPIVGDPEYGNKKVVKNSLFFRPLLHSKNIEVEGIILSSPLPKEFSLS